jgi:hypothetical protein
MRYVTTLDAAIRAGLIDVSNIKFTQDAMFAATITSNGYNEGVGISASASVRIQGADFSGGLVKGLRDVGPGEDTVARMHPSNALVYVDTDKETVTPCAVNIALNNKANDLPSIAGFYKLSVAMAQNRIGMVPVKDENGKWTFDAYFGGGVLNTGFYSNKYLQAFKSNIKQLIIFANTGLGNMQPPATTTIIVGEDGNKRFQRQYYQSSNSSTQNNSVAVNPPQSKAEQLAAAIAQIPQAAKLGNSKNTKGLSM